VKIRNFHLADQGACLAVFDSNVPDFFLASERQSFSTFLSSADFLRLPLRNAVFREVTCTWWKEAMLSLHVGVSIGRTKVWQG
jgi:hypothetical protein